jgi:hypothetical protein
MKLLFIPIVLASTAFLCSCGTRETIVVYQDRPQVKYSSNRSSSNSSPTYQKKTAPAQRSQSDTRSSQYGTRTDSNGRTHVDVPAEELTPAESVLRIDR